MEITDGNKGRCFKINLPQKNVIIPIPARMTDRVKEQVVKALKKYLNSDYPMYMVHVSTKQTRAMIATYGCIEAAITVSTQGPKTARIVGEGWTCSGAPRKDWEELKISASITLTN